MEIKLITTNKKQFLDLLLLADESETMIGKYLERGDLFALFDNGLKSVCVVTSEGGGIFELKNLATYEKYQKQGYATALINYIFDYYKDKGQYILVGTGESKNILSFYKKHGFEISHRIVNFFTDNYSHPMFEDGKQLIDMIYLKKNL